jgi:hypothetical protein
MPMIFSRPAGTPSRLRLHDPSSLRDPDDSSRFAWIMFLAYDPLYVPFSPSGA